MKVLHRHKLALSIHALTVALLAGAAQPAGSPGARSNLCGLRPADAEMVGQRLSGIFGSEQAAPLKQRSA